MLVTNVKTKKTIQYGQSQRFTKKGFLGIPVLIQPILQSISPLIFLPPVLIHP